MRQTSPRTDSWPDIVRLVSSVVDLDETARSTKAFLRPRGLRSPEILLRLALMYGAGAISLRGVAAEAARLGLAAVSDVAVLNRLRNCGDWLALLLERLLAARAGLPASDAAAGALLRLVLVDGSTVSAPGSGGSDWRLHARYEPGAGRFTGLVLTEATCAESLSCVAVSAGDVIVCDRGYARVRNFAAVRQAGSHFITRIGWRSVKLFDPDGNDFDPLAHLPASGQDVVEHTVRLGTGAAAATARLVIKRIPPEMLERQKQRLRRKQSRKGQRTDPRTILAAGFMMLLTSVPAELCPAERVVALYRLRWQIELAFKRLKSIGGLGDLPASDPRLARTWLLAQLIIAVLNEDLATRVLDSPPSTRRHSTDAPTDPLASM